MNVKISLERELFHLVLILTFNTQRDLNLHIASDAFDLQEQEYYVCIYTQRDADVILFHHEGGMDVGDIDSKVSSFYRMSHKDATQLKLKIFQNC